MISPQLALLLIPALPLLAGLLCLLLSGRLSARVCGWAGVAALLGSALFAVQLFPVHGADISLPWINMPDAILYATTQGGQLGYGIPFALHLGDGQLLFALSCALIAALVLVFALRERKGDIRAGGFHSLITLFAAAMLLFVCSDTLLVAYISWEAMGLFSFLLIAHPATEAARRAARQAFWTTRVTDFGLLFAVLLLMVPPFGWHSFSAIDVHEMVRQAQAAQINTAPLYAMLGAAGLLALFAALGKAAQLPLSFWLADAMLAPAPVSALLHAAAMVAAGPFLLFQFHNLFITSQLALQCAVLLGGISMLGAGLMALCASDAKRLLAYSTVSQLGLCIMSVGSLAEEAGMFQLGAHAWLKAALFLSVGYLAAASANHSSSFADLRGRARGSLVGLVLVICAVGLVGVWGLGGFWGKEQIILALLTRAQASPGEGIVLGQALPLAAQAWSIGAILALLGTLVTAAYSTKLVVLLLRPAGNSTEAAAAKTKDSGWGPAQIALLLLSLIGAFGLTLAWGNYRQAMLSDSTAWRWVEGAQASQGLLLTSMISLAGVLAAWYFYAARPQLGASLTRSPILAGLHSFFASGMRLREFWHGVIAIPGWFAALRAQGFERNVLDTVVEGTGQGGRLLARAAAWFDQHVVDGLRYRACDFWWEIQRRHMRWLQTGSIQHYMLVILIGAVVLCFVVARPLAKVFSQILGRY